MPLCALRSAVLLIFAPTCGHSLQAIAPPPPSLTDDSMPACSGIDLDISAALLGVTDAADLQAKVDPADTVLALDGSGHTIAVDRRRVVVPILQEAQREVLRLEKSLAAAQAMSPSQAWLSRGSAGGARSVPVTANGVTFTEVQHPHTSHHGNEVKYNISELRYNLQAACTKLQQLKKALAASEDSVHELATNNVALARERSKAPLPPSVPLTNDTHFDIVVNAFKRDMELEFSLRKYLDCQKTIPIAKIHVVWNDWNRSIPENLLKLKVSYFVPPVHNTNISNRFWPLDFASDAVFHVDDDVPHFCEILSDLFQLWRSDVDGIAGTSPRLLDLGAGGLDGYAVPLVWGQYNAVWVTKGAMVHRRFFEEYWKPVWAPIRATIDAYNCAEDMLFSAIHKTIVGKGHVYTVAASVNHGRRVLLEGFTLYTELAKVESYTGLNVRTWPVRGLAGEAIGRFLHEQFPERVKEGVYFDITKKFWRSTAHPTLSCKQLPLPCYNRDWPECWQECGDDAVRGTNVCFRGDGACYAGLGMSLGMDVGEQMMVVCVNGTCSALLQQ